jgi:hypothetical protein
VFERSDRDQAVVVTTQPSTESRPADVRLVYEAVEKRGLDLQFVTYVSRSFEHDHEQSGAKARCSTDQCR